MQTNYTPERLQEDLEVLVLRLLCEDPNTMAPETVRVMRNWAPIVLYRKMNISPDNGPQFEHGEW